MEEAEQINMTIDTSLSEVESTLMRGDTLLEEADNLTEVCV